MAEEQQKKNRFDNQIPGRAGQVLGKLGAKSWLDLLVMIAGIVCFIIILVQLLQWVTTPNVNIIGWKLIYYLLCLWVFFATALFIKLGPFLASKFKSVSSALSFLRDENDAKNFVVVMGAWTAVLDALNGAIQSTTSIPPAAAISNWTLIAYIGPIAIFGFYLLKGFFSRKQAA